MDIKYRILYQEAVVRKNIPSLSPAARPLMKKAIASHLMVDPMSFGKPLRYSLKGHRRLRVGDYQVVYRIETDTVIIITIKHRKDVYENQ